MHITSRENPKIKETVRLQGSAEARRAAGALVCEGPVLLEEALRSGLMPLQVFALPQAAAALPPGLDCPVYTVAPEVLDKLSDTQSPQGLVFTLPLPQGRPPEAGPVLALDGLADPGNLGTILRTADALGAAAALLPGCADPYSPKAVRAAMGSLFRVAPWLCDYGALARLCRERGIPIWGAALADGSADLRTAGLRGACILIGNEARGISPQGQAICQGRVIIPMRGAQSLNAAVAAGILLWEAVR